jgi:hypothetical protein
MYTAFHLCLRQTSLIALRRSQHRAFSTSFLLHDDRTPPPQERSVDKVWKSATDAIADLESGKILLSGVRVKIFLRAQAGSHGFLGFWSLRNSGHFDTRTEQAIRSKGPDCSFK